MSFSSMEYNNNLTSPSNEYGTPSMYNTLIAQKLPPTVPSMQFPTVLDQNPQVPYGYDALTHDGDGTAYYTVNKAYGNACNPSFSVVKCPSNKFIRHFQPGPQQFVSPAPSAACEVQTEFVSEGFSTDVVETVKKLKITFFYDPKSCPHSLKAYKALVDAIGTQNLHDSSVISVKNIREKSNEQEMTNLGGYALPFFFSATTNNSVTGFVPVNVLLEELGKPVKEGFDKPPHYQELQNLHVTVYVMKGCHFCSKIEKMLEPYKSIVTFKEASQFPNEVKGFRGFPTSVSATTKGTYIGLPRSLEDFIQGLKKKTA